MSTLLSSNSYAFQPRQAKGGLIQVLPSLSSRIRVTLQRAITTAKTEKDLFLWIADEGVLYAEAIHQMGALPLSRLLLIHAPSAEEVWRTGMESAQTGLFHFLFFKASRPCSTPYLRKLQLIAQKNQCEIFLLTHTPLPHWTLKETLGDTDGANPVHKKSSAHAGTRRELLHSYA